MTLTFLALQGALHICDISRLRVKPTVTYDDLKTEAVGSFGFSVNVYKTAYLTPHPRRQADQLLASESQTFHFTNCSLCILNNV
jgi:hypothetical protein